MTRITGSFRAWTLIIAAFSLLTIQSIVGFALTLSPPADRIANLISFVRATTTIPSSMVTAIAGALLFFEVFGLVKMIRKPGKPSA